MSCCKRGQMIHHTGFKVSNDATRARHRQDLENITGQNRTERMDYVYMGQDVHFIVEAI